MDKPMEEFDFLPPSMRNKNDLFLIGHSNTSYITPPLAVCDIVILYYISFQIIVVNNLFLVT
jgi:hypothetical protein